MSDEATAECCVLQHRGFAALGNIVFRRSAADDTPVVVVDLGGREAALSLTALQHELGIPDDSFDGRMLGRIGESLSYVAGLRLGDPLPSEVLSGEASWQPRREHRARAVANLHMQLVTWLDSETGDATLSGQTLSAERLESDPRLRAHLGAAFARAATQLDLPDSEAVVVLLEGIGQELGFIEALREMLLGRVQTLVGRLDGLIQARLRGDATRHDSLAQIHRLANIAVRQLESRFAGLDAQTGEVIATLRNIEAQRVFIRSHRNWMHRSRLAWEPILQAWEATPPRVDEGFWTLVGRTYHFLAPRFMPVQEWQASAAVARANRTPKQRQVLRW